MFDFFKKIWIKSPKKSTKRKRSGEPVHESLSDEEIMECNCTVHQKLDIIKHGIHHTQETTNMLEDILYANEALISKKIIECKNDIIAAINGNSGKCPINKEEKDSIFDKIISEQVSGYKKRNQELTNLLDRPRKKRKVSRKKRILKPCEVDVKEGSTINISSTGAMSIEPPKE